VEAQASEFLLICTGMLALFLGFTKRRQEAILEEESRPAESSAAASGSAGSGITRPVLEHYSLPFLDQMVAMVTATAILSYVIYAVDSPRIGSKMLATAPSVLYGIFRYLYLIYDRRDTRSTARILTEDPGMIFAGVTWVGSALLMLYAFDDEGDHVDLAAVEAARRQTAAVRVESIMDSGPYQPLSVYVVELPNDRDAAIVAAAADRRDWPDEIQIAVAAGPICAVVRIDFRDDEPFVENVDGLERFRPGLLAAIRAGD